MISFGSNIPSLGAQRRIAESSRAVRASAERLSSGLRINRASDDAAGLGIADSLRAASALSSSAMRNVNDGVSLLSIVDSALGEQTGVAQRLLELAEQASNGTLSNAQRLALDAEYQSLLRESGRIGDATRFNGLSVLRGRRAGTAAEILLQAGITGGAASQIGIATPDTGSLSGTINLDDINLSKIGNLLAAWIADGRTTYTKDELLEAFDGRVYETTGTDSTGATRRVLVGFGGETSDGFISLLGFVQSTSDPAVWENSMSFGDLTAAEFGADGKFIDPVISDPSALGLTQGEISSIALDLAGLQLRGDSSGYGNLGQGSTTAVDFTSIAADENAARALTIARQRLDELNRTRGEVGAATSRLMTASNVLSVSRENLTSAESRIRDVDVSEEAARSVSSNLALQAGTAVLAQANLLPELLLRLLEV